MHVLEIWRYPVKSMGGERLASTTLSVNGVLGDREWVVVDGEGRIVTSRTRPGLLLMHASLDSRGRVVVDGHDVESCEVASRIRSAAGAGARAVRVPGPERFDILPLMVTSDGAIAALGEDRRRLRPNLLIGGVEGLAERAWEGKSLAVGDAVIGLADLRARCIMTTFDPETGAQDVGVLRRIRARFDGTFGLNAWVARPAAIAVGARVRLL